MNLDDYGLNPEDFCIQVLYTSRGGFFVGANRGVRITHKPTGVSVECDTERSQHANRHKAFDALVKKVKDRNSNQTHAALIERLREDASYHEDSASQFDMRPQDTVNWQHMQNCLAAAALEALTVQIAKAIHYPRLLG